MSKAWYPVWKAKRDASNYSPRNDKLKMRLRSLSHLEGQWRGCLLNCCDKWPSKSKWWTTYQENPLKVKKRCQKRLLIKCHHKSMDLKLRLRRIQHLLTLLQRVPPSQLFNSSLNRVKKSPRKRSINLISKLLKQATSSLYSLLGPVISLMNLCKMWLS